MNMFQIRNRFKAITEQYPLYSSYICFAKTVKNTSLSESAIRRWFYLLVDPDDYAADEVRTVLRHVVSLAKPPNLKTPSQTTRYEGKSARTKV